MTSLKEQYLQSIISALSEELGIKNQMALPKLRKVILNVGIGGAKLNPKIAEAARETLKSITGQAPIVRKSRKAISGFKIRENEEVGLMVTLRGDKMYDFVQKLAHVTLPRLRDFRGLDQKSFDKAGNISLGFKEQIIFPEIDFDKIDAIRGMDICFSTTAKSDLEARALLEAFRFPFKV